MKKIFLLLAIFTALVVVGCGGDSLETECESDAIFNEPDIQAPLMDAEPPAVDNGTGTVQPGDEVDAVKVDGVES